MKLEFPHKKHKIAYEELIKRWEKIEDLSEISPGALFYGNKFEDFLENTINYLDNKTKPVNSHLFFLVENEEILGGIQIRHHIKHPNLIEKGGHIGYGVAPKFRKKGYATKMLKLALLECSKLGLKKILITCGVDNIASRKVIEKNGGVFERLTNDGAMNRFWIKL